MWPFKKINDLKTENFIFSASCIKYLVGIILILFWSKNRETWSRQKEGRLRFYRNIYLFILFLGGGGVQQIILIV